MRFVAKSFAVSSLGAGLILFPGCVDIVINDKINPTCMQIKDVQQCWGNVTVSNEDRDGNFFYHTFSVTFPIPFAKQPTVTDSIQANFPSAGPAYAIYASNVTESGWSGSLVRLTGREGANPPLLKMQYMAIGLKRASER